MIFSFCSFFITSLFSSFCDKQGHADRHTHRVENREIERWSFCSFWIPRFSASQTDRQSWERQRYRRNKRDDIFGRLRSRSFFHLLWETRPDKQTEMISLFLFDPASFSFFERQGHTDRQSWERQRYEREREMKGFSCMESEEENICYA